MSIPEKEHKERLFWYKKGLIDKKIGEKVNKTQKTIYNWRKRYDLKANGKKNKISNDKIQKIHYFNQKGLSIAEIARILNCSTGSVYYWINNSN